MSDSFLYWIFPISSTSVAGTSKFIVHIPRIPRTDVILIYYFVKVQVMTISRSVSYIIKPRTGAMAPRRIIMVQRETFLKVHLGSIRPIALLGEFRVRVGGIRYSL